MIPPVERYTAEELDDDTAWRSRPQWFKFFYAAWLLSTMEMNDQQRGWYIHLLSWAASEGDMPGYLPEDENRIKQIAGFSELPRAIAKSLGRGIQFSQNMLDEFRQDQETDWQKVRSKFSKDPLNPGYIRNRKLAQTLKFAYKKSKQASYAASEGVAKRVREKELAANAEQTQSETHGSAEQKDILLQTQDVSSERSQNAQASAERVVTVPLSLTLNTNNLDSNSSNETKEQESNSITKGKSKPKTLFDEKKFELTEDIQKHLVEKHPLFQTEDVEHMIEKFCNIFYGKTAISWKRTFYVFIKNEIQYGYKLKGVQNNNGNPRFIQASERNAANQRAINEWTNSLPESNQLSHPNNPPGLSLTSDDD